MLLYSAFGSNAQKDEKIGGKPADKEKLRIFQGLGKNPEARREKLRVYHTIFSNNNKALRDRFFRDEVIKSIWPYVLPFITYELCFTDKDGVVGGPNADTVPSF